ncbi:MAG: prolyl oligopeptidase family serine peptidase [Sphingobacteriia bacterium]|nr:prolyl oligopeptidase family serine peptidase [Sphingobacteriia bacterium]
MKYPLLFVCFMTLAATAFTQEAQKYEVPPKEILDLIDIKPAPAVRIDQNNRYIVELDRLPFKTLAELAEDEVKLAGLRINPQLNSPGRQGYYYGISIKEISTGKEINVKGLPQNVRLNELSFSPNGELISFLVADNDRMSLWILELKTGNAQQISNSKINGVLGSSYTWDRNSKSLLVKRVPEDRKELSSARPLPEGPSIQEATGNKAPVRTYQDLLRNPYDEQRFEYYASSEIVRISLEGQPNIVLPSALWRSIELSPDGEYILAQKIVKPYSYIVPFSRFASEYVIFDKGGKLVSDFYKKPLIEQLPTGFDAVPTGRRGIEWRSDKPSTLFWAEAADGGDPAIKTEVRDRLFMQSIPIKEEPRLFAETSLRYSGIIWGNNNGAILMTDWWKTRKEQSIWLTDLDGKTKAELWFDRNSEDLYKDPGDFVTVPNQYGRWVLAFSKSGKALYLRGEGYSPEGNKPFIDQFSIEKRKTKRLWQAEGLNTYESIVRILNVDDLTFITTIESTSQNPNLWIHIKGDIKQLTNFANPYQSFSGVTKETIHYTRKDGVALSGTLYLPKGFDMLHDEPLPLLMWAYPQEFKGADQAGQIKDSPYRFAQIYYGSPVMWAQRGYAILDDTDFPIIGEGENEPNDTFVEQLVSNASAAIDYLAEKGIADRKRVAIGGHSYGAFMVANLLAHSDLFAAGIARSGAYNRTLTPFGFQSEERTFWEAPKVYMEMSPFVYADKIKSPLLLIHGDADNNPGTFTLQSERLFGAIKGLGGVSRLVLLPFESHGYSARENILHVLWETDQWLEKYVKTKK